MTKDEALKKLHKGITVNRNYQRKVKGYKSDYYSMNSIFGNDWAMFYALLGGRCCGKSYAALEWVINRKLKKGDKLKVFWMRLTDAQALKLLEGGGDNLVDPAIKRKYNLNLCKRYDKIMMYDEEQYVKGGELKKRKVNEREFCLVLSCSTFYSHKGVASYDQDFEKIDGSQYVFILDEFEKELNEKSQGDIVAQFTNAIHNKCRNAKNVKVIMIGNTLAETSDILAAFNFIPIEFGRYKLKSKRCVIDYIVPTEKYKEQQKGTVLSYLQKNSSSFTNINDENMLDAKMLVNKRRCTTPLYTIMFGKEAGKMFTVWNDNIIKQYNGEACKQVPMNRYLNAVYDAEARLGVLDMFDYQQFKFTNLATFLQFQTQLKLIRKK